MVIVRVKIAQLNYWVFECLPEFLKDLLKIKIGNKMINYVDNIAPHKYNISIDCELLWS